MPKRRNRKQPPNYRRDYVCSTCGQWGLRLWRDYSTSADAVDLQCATCLTPEQAKLDIGAGPLAALDADGVFAYRDGDQLGGKVPAVPTPDGSTFWGYTSVDDEGITWWEAMPTYRDPVLEIRCLRAVLDRRTKRLRYYQNEALGCFNREAP